MQWTPKPRGPSESVSDCKMMVLKAELKSKSASTLHLTVFHTGQMALSSGGAAMSAGLLFGASDLLKTY